MYPLFFKYIVNAPCYACKDVGDNRICLICSKVGCSAQRKGHMKGHCEGHNIVMSLSDGTYWCYNCDSYITNKELEQLKIAFLEKKLMQMNPLSILAKAFGNLSLEEEKAPKITALQLAKQITAGNFKKVVVLTGAGISVNAGIPDFRTPGTGLYSQLEKYKLPYPEAVFTLDYFEENPEPFYKLAKEMFGKKYLPTKTHYFIRLLQEKGMLLRNYTQNIDNLEIEAGIKQDLLIQAHGTYTSSHCIKCKSEVSLKAMMKAITSAKPKHCKKCEGLCKPDIVFFGETMAKRYKENMDEVETNCDLVIIMGTSLVVAPFSMLSLASPKTVPRLIINRELPDLFKERNGIPCAFMEGDCDIMIEKLVKMLGWEKEFNALMKKREAFARKHLIMIPRKK